MNDITSPPEKLPSRIFIPIFVLLGVAIICAAVALIIVWRRKPRHSQSLQNAKGALYDAKRARFPGSFKGTGGMTKSALQELQFNLPLNHQQQEHNKRQQLAPSRTPSMLDRSRPNTAGSAFSETFRRPWRARSVIPAEGNFWGRNTHDHGVDAADLEWSPPTDWQVVGPVDGSKYVPTVPMPAFLGPPRSVDPRTIDPSSFPLLASMSAQGYGRWSASQASSHHGHGRSSSVAGDSLFCTCDLEDIDEEGASSSGRLREDGGRLSTGSSIHISTGKCRACMRRSAAAAAAGTGYGSPSPGTPAFSRHPSIKTARKPRRNRIPNAKRSKIAVAGRLYEESEGRPTPGSDASTHV